MSAAEIKPDYPYIKFWRPDARKVTTVPGSTPHDTVGEDVTYFRVTGCHINQESVLNTKNNGWVRVVEYGNFDVRGDYRDGKVVGRKKEYAELAQWLENTFGYELGEAKKEAAAKAEAEAKAKMRAEIEAEMAAKAEVEAKVKEEAEAKAKAEAEAKAKAEAEAKGKGKEK